MESIGKGLNYAQLILIVLAGVVGMIGENQIYGQLKQLIVPLKPCEGGDKKCLDTIVQTKTGGTCGFLNCDASRGNTICKDGECICQDGYQANSGSCEPIPSTLRTYPLAPENCEKKIEDSTCGDRAWVDKSCSNDRGVTNCNNGYCECASDTCILYDESMSDGECVNPTASKSNPGLRAYKGCYNGNVKYHERTAAKAETDFSCTVPKMFCQTLLFSDKPMVESVSASANLESSGEVDTGVEADMGEASVGHQKSDIEKTCGVKDDCSIDKTWFREASLKSPPFPYTLIWMIFRLYSAELLITGLRYFTNGRATVLELTTNQCCPVIPMKSVPGCSQLNGLFTFIKLKIVPQLVLPMVSTLATLKTCPNIMTTRAPDFAVLEVVYWFVFLQLILSLVFVPGFSCVAYCLNDDKEEKQEEPRLEVEAGLQPEEVTVEVAAGGILLSSKYGQHDKDDKYVAHIEILGGVINRMTGKVEGETWVGEQADKLGNKLTNEITSSWKVVKINDAEFSTELWEGIIPAEGNVSEAATVVFRKEKMNMENLLYFHNDAGDRVGINSQSLLGLGPPGWCGLCCFTLVGCADCAILIMIPIYMVSMIEQFGLSVSLAFAAAFTFDVKFSVFVDIFQLMLMLINLFDVVHSIHKQWQRGKQVGQQHGVGTVGAAVQISDAKAADTTDEQAAAVPAAEPAATI